MGIRIGYQLEHSRSCPAIKVESDVFFVSDEEHSMNYEETRLIRFESRRHPEVNKRRRRIWTNSPAGDSPLGPTMPIVRSGSSCESSYSSTLLFLIFSIHLQLSDHYACLLFITCNVILIRFQSRIEIKGGPLLSDHRFCAKRCPISCARFRTRAFVVKAHIVPFSLALRRCPANPETHTLQCPPPPPPTEPPPPPMPSNPTSSSSCPPAAHSKICRKTSSAPSTAWAGPTRSPPSPQNSSAPAAVRPSTM